MAVNLLILLCPLSFAFLGVLGAGLLGYLAYQRGQKKVKAARVVKCKIAEMRDGVCRVKGRLVAREEPLKSPLTNKPCLYFSFKVEQAVEVRTWNTVRLGGVAGAMIGPQESTSTSERWTPMLEDVQRVAVALEDETGQAYLDLGEAQLDAVAQKKEGIIDTSKEGGLQFEMMLQKRYGESTLVDRRSGVSQSFSRRASRMSQGRELPRASVCEEVIENGVEVYVLGEAEIREGKPPRFRPADHPLIVTTKAKRASLPTPGNPATGLWVAAGLVLGLSVVIGLFTTAVGCAGLLSGSHSVSPPAVHPFPGR